MLKHFLKFLDEVSETDNRAVKKCRNILRISLLICSLGQRFSTDGPQPTGGLQRFFSGPLILSHFVSNRNFIHNYFNFIKVQPY